MPDEIFVGLCVLPIIAMPFLFFGFLRYMRYKETLALADRGMLTPTPAARNGRDALRWGIVITLMGLALTCGLYPIGWAVGGDEFPLGFGPWMLAGLIPTAFGLSLLIIYRVTRDENGAAAGADLPGSGAPGELPESGTAAGPAAWGDAAEADAAQVGGAEDAG